MEPRLNISLREQSFYMNYAQRRTSDEPMKAYHLHQEYEIFYLLAGGCTYDCREEVFSVEENQLVFIPKNMVHKTSKQTGQAYERLVINFQEDLVTGQEKDLLSSLFQDHPLRMSVPIERQVQFHSIFQQLFDEYQNKDWCHDIYTRALLVQLLVESERLLHTQTERSVIKTAENKKRQLELVSRMIQFINANFAQALSLSSLALRFHMNEQSLSRLFKQVTGCGVVEYVNAVRINEAKRLLIETNLKINRIALQIGFTNHVHLWRMFNRITGRSPHAFRIEHRTS
ncbi:helix-turn-helix domain-containing protein [Aureibacillus halotolerans]|uniref:AraC-like protein n=1 Tax=Aureibacillus halotolerans TaxID=1508390 RepID=A0A4R6TZI8_9BACI|nr:AraC family transcriptional regulator [Aureibacillus halotolerans]TDQ36214.1 AraC-like protein [Aureibacillus halotolerans]